MVQIGKTVKYDKYGRVTLPVELAELLELEKEDFVTWHVEKGNVVLKKLTKVYLNNFDFESEEIRERLLEYEEDNVGKIPEDDLDPEELKIRARELYERDKELKRKRLSIDN